MDEDIIGEIKLMAFSIIPEHWKQCNGQILKITDYVALYSVLGTRYGGDGKSTFALPDLRGRVPMHFNPNFPLGVAGGEAKHTLTTQEMPMHSHLAQGSNAAGTVAAAPNAFLGQLDNGYGSLNSNVTSMSDNEIGNTGESAGHENMQPFLCLNFCIRTGSDFSGRS